MRWLPSPTLPGFLSRRCDPRIHNSLKSIRSRTAPAPKKLRREIRQKKSAEVTESFNSADTLLCFARSRIKEGLAKRPGKFLEFAVQGPKGD